MVVKSLHISRLVPAYCTGRCSKFLGYGILTEILSNFQCNMQAPNMKYADFLQLIIKIHIKAHMKTVGTTEKTQRNPLNEGAENTCFRDF